MAKQRKSVNDNRDKLFVVRKYVMARSAADALRKESTIPADEVFVDEKWADGGNRGLSEAVGFAAPKEKVIEAKGKTI